MKDRFAENGGETNNDLTWVIKDQVRLAFEDYVSVEGQSQAQPILPEDRQASYEYALEVALDAYNNASDIFEAEQNANRTALQAAKNGDWMQAAAASITSSNLLRQRRTQVERLRESGGFPSESSFEQPDFDDTREDKRAYKLSLRRHFPELVVPEEQSKTVHANDSPHFWE